MYRDSWTWSYIRMTEVVFMWCVTVHTYVLEYCNNIIKTCSKLTGIRHFSL